MKAPLLKKTLPWNGVFVWRSIFALFFTLSFTQGEVLLNNTFDDGEYTEQRLPDHAAWQKIANSVANQKTTTLEVSGKALVLTADSKAGQAQTLARFSDGAKVLNVGETMVLSFKLSLSSPAAIKNGLRFGIFNSNDYPVVNQGYTSDVRYHKWTGYSIWTNVGSPSAGGTTIRKRVGEDPTLFNGEKGLFAILPGSERGFELTSGVAVKGTLTIKRTGEDQAAIKFEMNDIIFACEDSSNICKGFDTIVFRVAPEATGALTLDDVSVARTP